MSLFVGHATAKVFEGEGVIKLATYFQIHQRKKGLCTVLTAFFFFFSFFVILRLFPNKYLN